MAYKRLENSNLDILNGPILKNLIIFTVPLMVTNMLQILYSAADMIIVGYSGVEGAIGAIGTTNAVINLIINLFIGLSTGTNIIVSRHIGEDNTDKITKSVHTSLIVSIMAGLLCGILGFLLCRPLLSLIGDEGHILDLATTYSKIYFAGVPFVSITNFLIAIYRAKGDTKTAFGVLTYTGLFNVILNIFFVFVMNMSVDGVALATVISNISSAAILWNILSKDSGCCKFEKSKFHFDKDEFKEIVRNGIPAGIQGMVFSLSNVFIQNSVLTVNNIFCPGGSAVIDANAAVLSIEGFVYTATNSIAIAVTTFVSQHYGATKYERMKHLVRVSYAFSTVVTLIFSSVILIFERQLLGMFVSDPVTIEIGCKMLLYVVAPFILLAYMDIGSSALKGMNKPVISALISLTGSCILRILWLVIVFPTHQTIETICLSYPISWVLTALTLLVFVVVTEKRLLQQNDMKKVASSL